MKKKPGYVEGLVQQVKAVYRDIVDTKYGKALDIGVTALPVAFWFYKGCVNQAADKDAVLYQVLNGPNPKYKVAGQVLGGIGAYAVSQVGIAFGENYVDSLKDGMVKKVGSATLEVFDTANNAILGSLALNATGNPLLAFQALPPLVAALENGLNHLVKGGGEYKPIAWQVYSNVGCKSASKTAVQTMVGEYDRKDALDKVIKSRSGQSDDDFLKAISEVSPGAAQTLFEEFLDSSICNTLKYIVKGETFNPSELTQSVLLSTVQEFCRSTALVCDPFNGTLLQGVVTEAVLSAILPMLDLTHAAMRYGTECYDSLFDPLAIDPLVS